MAPLRAWLGLGPHDPDVEPLEVELVSSLDALKPPHAKFLTAYAAVLSRVAYSDRVITADEAAVMSTILQTVDEVSRQDADLIVAIANGGARRLGDSEWRDAARVLGHVATRAQRLGLLRSLYAVAAADQNIELEQIEEIEKIGRELGLSTGDVESVRLQLGGSPVGQSSS